MRKSLAPSALALIVACFAGSAFADTNLQFVPPVPGNVVDSKVVYLTGDGDRVSWKAVISKKLRGSSNGIDFYQWYLSIYALRRGAYRLRYQSPGNGGPLSAVTRAPGAATWFPMQDIDFSGVGSLMQPSVQNLVVQSNEAAADCGGATVTVFAGGPGGSVVQAVKITNFCDLGATIQHTTEGDVVRLYGPYYAPNAPLCCPTKPEATATLRYSGGKWIESPTYFKIE